ncbi:hypothetical protein MLD38_018323 [Melastoma candidum]|uniref:Uncharacterized protein n=1 Tax=Melastoma candidum TaxID=119954 RepID=A0ACB9QSL2_9MYRT|nr:hypothetical protein MLD38_018323 [Melastoma candidum]
MICAKSLSCGQNTRSSQLRLNGVDQQEFPQSKQATKGRVRQQLARIFDARDRRRLDDLPGCYSVATFVQILRFPWLRF